MHSCTHTHTHALTNACNLAVSICELSLYMKYTSRAPDFFDIVVFERLTGRTRCACALSSATLSRARYNWGTLAGCLPTSTTQWLRLPIVTGISHAQRRHFRESSFSTLDLTCDESIPTPPLPRLPPPVAAFGKFLSIYLSISDRQFCSAVTAATMAGAPRPCVMREKCVRWRCMPGSSIVWGRVLPSGDRSWLSKSRNSFTSCLEDRERMTSNEDNDIILTVILYDDSGNYTEAASM